MKKFLSVLLCTLIIVPSTMTFVPKEYTPPVDEITKEKAYQLLKILVK